MHHLLVFSNNYLCGLFISQNFRWSSYKSWCWNYAGTYLKNRDFEDINFSLWFARYDLRIRILSKQPQSGTLTAMAFSTSFKIWTCVLSESFLRKHLVDVKPMKNFILTTTLLCQIGLKNDKNILTCIVNSNMLGFLIIFVMMWSIFKKLHSSQEA